MVSSPAINNRRRAIAVAIALVGLGVASWFYRLCWIDPAIRFLAPYRGADWIVFPKPATFDGRPQIELTTTFRTRWTMAEAPRDAVLEYRAAEHAKIRINRQEIAAPATPQNWKAAVQVEVGERLQAGENEIAITVANGRAPPALWAKLDAVNVRTGHDWEASYAGSAWRKAIRASEPLPERRDQTDAPFARFGPAWSAKWPMVVALLAGVLVVGGLWKAWCTWVARGREKRDRWSTNPATMTLVAAMIGWTLVLAHNAAVLPRYTGFDAVSHFEYIRFLLNRHVLPLAPDGMVMYNPPLYYGVAAGLVSVTGIDPSTLRAAEFLRGLALLGGLTQLGLIAAILRLAFPEHRGAQALGLAFAATLPANLYVWHYVTNEWLVALLVTLTVYVTLRAITASRATMRGCALVGACLGTALLTKVTALLAAPFVVCAIAWKLWRDRVSTASALARVAVLLATAVVLCGWHYGRVWIHLGKPIVGAWDPESGLAWWQDQGYVTFSQFFRFGEALANPIFSARLGFWDGFYSTLWGDGLCGGMADPSTRPPWDYALMTTGMTLAIPLTALLVTGVGVSVARFAKSPTPLGLLVNGMLVGFAGAFVLMYLKVPCYGDLKAFYGLVVLPAAAIAVAQLFSSPRFASARIARATALLMGGWAATTFATYWIDPESAQSQLLLGIDANVASAAESRFVAATKADPSNDLAWENLVAARDAQHRSEDAARTLATALETRPDSVRLRAVAAARADSPESGMRALRELDRVLAQAPDSIDGWQAKIQLLRKLGNSVEMANACREALCSRPMDASLHLNLGLALAAAPEATTEALQQLVLTASLAPNQVENLEPAAWTLVTHSSDRVRDTELGAKIAQKVVELTQDRSFVARLALAVAAADAGQFDAAVMSATRAADIARTNGSPPDFARQADALAKRFREGKPFHPSAR